MAQPAVHLPKHDGGGLGGGGGGGGTWKIEITKKGVGLWHLPLAQNTNPAGTTDALAHGVGLRRHQCTERGPLSRVTRGS